MIRAALLISECQNVWLINTTINDGTALAGAAVILEMTAPVVYFHRGELRFRCVLPAETAQAADVTRAYNLSLPFDVI